MTTTKKPQPALDLQQRGMTLMLPPAVWRELADRAADAGVTLNEHLAAILLAHVEGDAR